jgi:hypothetical protein
MTWRLLLLLSPVLAPFLVPDSVAQSKPPKVDSLLATIALPKAEASDAVVTAFTAAGLSVTDQTSSIITADQGETKDELFGYNRRRVVRATLLPKGADTTRVLIQGTEEVRRRDVLEKRKRIDNYARGNGEKVWAKMLAAARALDSSSVTAEALTVPEANPRKRKPGQP